ncbi:MAG TPA: heme-binding protein [Crenalkalicoccus sp.]|nr:heme-binding protein [Crenalkalicoccus sp.]
MLDRIGALLSGLAFGACSVIGRRAGIEEPSYTVADRLGPVEIRAYGPRLAAETVVEGDELAARSAGFRRLAAYIFGANHGGAKIAMTAPVAQSGQRIAVTAPVAQDEAVGGGWRIRFFMPAEWTRERLPAPNDPAVRIVEVPAVTMAVLRFSGVPRPEAVAEERAVLMRALAGSPPGTRPWHAVGEPEEWFYDPPWTLPPLRRNEVAVPVVR